MKSVGAAHHSQATLPLHIQQQYFLYDPVISDYFEPQDDNTSSSGRPQLTKREKLDMLFDGHKIKSPLDGFMFFLRFSLFILLINKLILITTFLIQGKLFDEINWHVVSSSALSVFIGCYFLATLFYIVMIPVPDNKCGCHFFLILSLVLLSSGELVLNQSNNYMQLTRGLHLICCSIDVFASLHLLCLAVDAAAACLSRFRSLQGSGRRTDEVWKYTTTENDIIDNSGVYTYVISSYDRSKEILHSKLITLEKYEIQANIRRRVA